MINFQVKRLQFEAMLSILKHFENAWLVICMRLGFLRLPYFLYRIANAGKRYSMLARPGVTSMADLFVLREIFVDETYRDILPLLPSRPVRVVDVGGNLGSFTVWIHLRHGITEAHCFEPDPVSFNLCRFNVTLNGCPAATVYPVAMGGQNRRVSMRVNTTRPGGQGIYERSGGEGGELRDVEVAAFGEWMEKQAGVFDVLKLDCEGAEWEILEHVPAQLWRRFTLVVAEVHHDPSGRCQVADFAMKMEKLGFSTVRWDGFEQSLYVGRRSGSS